MVGRNAVIERPPTDPVIATAVIGGTTYSYTVTADLPCTRMADILAEMEIGLESETGAAWAISYADDTITLTCSSNVSSCTIAPVEWSGVDALVLTAGVPGDGDPVVNSYEAVVSFDLPVCAPTREVVGQTVVSWEPLYYMDVTFMAFLGTVLPFDPTRENIVVVIDPDNPDPYALDNDTGYLALCPMGTNLSSAPLESRSMAVVGTTVEYMMLDFEV